MGTKMIALFVMEMLFVTEAAPLLPPAKTAMVPTPLGTPLLQRVAFVHIPEEMFVHVDCAGAGVGDIASPQARAKAKAHRKDQRRPPSGGVLTKRSKGSRMAFTDFESLLRDARRNDKKIRNRLRMFFNPQEGLAGAKGKAYRAGQ